MINEKRIKVNIIQHRNTEDFFRGFFSENDAIQYGYQLRRMFESSSSFENDYIVLEVDKKSFMSIEIFRTATRRILTLNPRLSPLFTDEQKKEFFASAFESFIAYETKMYQMIRFQNPLEVVLNSEFEFYEEMQFVLSKYEFKSLFTKFELDVEVTKIPKIYLDEKYGFDKFTNYEVDKRYEFIEKRDVYMNKMEFDIRKLYVDYIEENVVSEELWEVIKESNDELGYILPMFDIARKQLEIFDYGFFDKKNDINLKLLVARIKEIGLAKKVNEIKLNIYKEDEAIFNILQLDNDRKVIKKSYYYDSEC